MEQALRRAEILHEALPYIQRFAGKTVVIKYGGHAMVDPKLKESFARDVVLLKSVGINPVIVHGGGPQIDELLERLNIPARFVRGIRVTDDATMDVVEMVLVGKVNKEIVNLIQQAGGRCVGLSGKDGGLVTARRVGVPPAADGPVPPEIVDPGKVGEIEAIDATVIDALEAAGYIAVIAPVGRSAAGETLNINADLVAGRIAGALQAEKLILLTDVPGVKIRDRWVQAMDVPSIAAEIAGGEIKGGMIPKLECARDALAEGVAGVHILDGRQPHVVLLELFTDQGVGTMVRSDGGLDFRD
jgi:acetylglutamate kinase